MVTVRDVLKLDCLKGANVISGYEGLDNQIEYVDVIEMPDIDNWLKSNILMLTSFYAIRDDRVAQMSLIKKMAQTGVSGLILAPEFYLDRLNRDIIQLSNELDFPIIELPPEKGYADVIRPILEEVFNEKLDAKNKEERRKFFCSLLDGKYKNEKEVYREAEILDVNLLGLGVVMAMDIEKVNVSSLYGEKEITTRSDIMEKVLIKLSMFDNLIIINRYKNIIILPIIYNCDIDNKESISKICINIAKNIKSYIESEIKNITVVIGIGRYYKNILDINKSYEEAQKALIVSKNMLNKILLFEQLKIYKLLTKIDDKEELCIFYNETLYPLEKYDKENNTEFVDTLKTYFECNENMQVSSENLHIHINTMKYRMSRIKELLKVDDFNVDNKVELYLALKIREFL